MEAERYIQIMIQSLEKKKKLLNLIVEKNKAQTLLFSAEKYDNGAIDEKVREKGSLIEQMELLDSGFEKVYDRIREPLTVEKEKYAPQIAHMQQLISQIMEISIKIQSQEARNKELAKKFFTKNEQHVAKARTSNKVSNAYKNVMRGTTIPDAQFLDKKK